MSTSDLKKKRSFNFHSLALFVHALLKKQSKSKSPFMLIFDTRYFVLFPLLINPLKQNGKKRIKTLGPKSI